MHDLVFWHALALLIKGITSFVEHPIALKNQSYTSQVLKILQGSYLRQTLDSIMRSVLFRNATEAEKGLVIALAMGKV